jgi:hypothetical protein
MVKQPETQTALLRHIGDIEEKEQGVFKWFQRELTFDDGKTYPLCLQDKNQMDIGYAIDMEIEYSLNEKGNVRIHKIPPPPQRTVSKPKPLEKNEREPYWQNKDKRDEYDLCVRERQYWISYAREFVIPLGKMSEGNWEELCEKAAELGISLHTKHGKYKFGD